MSRRRPPTPTPSGSAIGQLDTIQLHRWRVSAVDAWPVRSVEAETFWLPIVGPTAFLVARRFSAWLEFHDPDAAGIALDVDVADLGRSMGVGGGGSRIGATLARLIQFRLAAFDGNAFAFRCDWEPLPERFWSRLPVSLQQALATTTPTGGIRR